MPRFGNNNKGLVIRAEVGQAFRYRDFTIWGVVEMVHGVKEGRVEEPGSQDRRRGDQKAGEEAESLRLIRDSLSSSASVCPEMWVSHLEQEQGMRGHAQRHTGPFPMTPASVHPGTPCPPFLPSRFPSSEYQSFGHS